MPDEKRAACAFLNFRFLSMEEVRQIFRFSRAYWMTQTLPDERCTNPAFFLQSFT
jgi:hypothetical protein